MGETRALSLSFTLVMGHSVRKAACASIFHLVMHLIPSKLFIQLIEKPLLL